MINFLVKCKHKEHYVINSDLNKQNLHNDLSNSKNSAEKNPFYPFSPYWLKANFLTEDYFQGNFNFLK